MMTKRELFNHYTRKCPPPKNGSDKLTPEMTKATMRYIYSGLQQELQHIPPDSELGMELVQKMRYYESVYKDWWEEKRKALAKKEAAKKPTNPPSMGWIHK